jgi:DNA adenine methylase
LVSLFPSHKTYVEPFFGGGAVFFEKEPSEVEVVNDLDPVLMEDYKRLTKAPLTGYKVLTTESAQNTFLQQKNKGVADRVLESLIRRCNGFGGKYVSGEVAKTTTHEDKLENLGEYKKRLNHATLTNVGYDEVLRKYDGADTFFFMDPPYEMSEGLGYAAGSESFPFAQFAEDLKGLKGKFLVTINDSRGIRKLFKGLNIYPYVVKGHHSEATAIGSKDRKELLVTNYELPSRWKSTLTGGTHRETVLKKLKPAGLSLPELAEASGESVGVLQQVYNRGIGAYKTNPDSVRKKGTFEKGPAPMSQKLSKEQWAKARVYSFLDGNPKHDTDLRGDGRPSPYLTEARRRAKVAGYDPELVSYANDGTHKLCIKTPTGQKVCFGREGYGDSILYAEMEKQGKVPKGTTAMKTRVFHASPSALKGKWRDNPYSPNRLALSILWA